jgi:hypothetical protein
MAAGLSWLCYFHVLRVGEASKVAPIDKLSVVLVIIFGACFWENASPSPKRGGATYGGRRDCDRGEIGPAVRKRPGTSRNPPRAPNRWRTPGAGLAAAGTAQAKSRRCFRPVQQSASARSSPVVGRRDEASLNTIRHAFGEVGESGADAGRPTEGENLDGPVVAAGSWPVATPPCKDSMAAHIAAGRSATTRKPAFLRTAGPLPQVTGIDPTADIRNARGKPNVTRAQVAYFQEAVNCSLVQLLYTCTLRSRSVNFMDMGSVLL